MKNPIIVSPSQDQNSLVNAILQANNENRMLNLQPGIHFTKPGKNEKIKLSDNGIRIKGLFIEEIAATIKRPDYSITTDPPASADENYGLFFIPEITDEDFRSVTSWNDYTDINNNSFEYAVIIQGEVTIENLVIDCNMGNQNLENIVKEDKEHSCMLGFSGTSVFRRSGEFANKKIYKGFKKVVVRNVVTKNGGHADDIWIGRGYFNPNIEEIKFAKIRSENRVNSQRSTIGFSGLCKKIQIQNADIFSLEAEDLIKTHWDQLPRDDEPYTPSNWILKDITADRIDIAAKGKVVQIDGENLVSKSSCNFYQTGGKIINSKFKKGNESRLIRLNSMKFKSVQWILNANAEGIVLGLIPLSDESDNCSVTFIENKFMVEGDFDSGALISSKYSRLQPSNTVSVILRDCKYDQRFGRSSDQYLIKAVERGIWKIKRSDFGDRQIREALFTNPELTDVEIIFT